MSQYPVKHISYSSMRSFHVNPGGWKEKYILGNRTFKMSPAMLVGKMTHAVIEAWMQGVDINMAQQGQLVGLNAIQDTEVNWGKTGSREKVIKDFTDAVRMYFEEKPSYEKILAFEHKMEHTISDMIGGTKIICPLPFYGIADLIFEENGEIIIEDYKIKASHTKDEEGPHPMYFTQAMFYYYLAREEYKKEPKEMRFREVKTSKNKDGTSQHNVITINFRSEEFVIFKAYFWYQLMGMLKMIENVDADTYFMYNTFDMLGGREAFEQLSQAQFGYKTDIKQSDIVRTEKNAIKETQFIEQTTPESIEGKMVFKFQEFGIALQFIEKLDGYAFDRYLFKPNRGVKMADVRKYADDVSQATAMENVRILAPVPGTQYVGVEVPREDRKFEKYKDGIMPIGKDIDGTIHRLDLTDSNTPHMIVAGRTGSGKSEFLKVLIESRSDCNLILIDPKRVELAKYKKIAVDYCVEPIEAWYTLGNLETTMKQRYEIMEQRGINNIGDMEMKRIVVIIEEYAALRHDKQYGGEIEKSILQLTNLGRAAGIHIIIATQRPEVKVITGAIKANIGCRVCFATASKIDSQIVIDQPGAEKLSGKGDMLYIYPGNEPLRLQSFHT